MQNKSPKAFSPPPLDTESAEDDVVTVTDTRNIYTRRRKTSSVDKGHDFLLKSPSEAKQEFNPKKILNIRVPVHADEDTSETTTSIDQQVFSIKYNSSGELLAAAFGNGIVRLYNCKGECIFAMNQALSGGGTQLPATAVTFRPHSQLFKPADKNVLLIGMADGALQHWDVDERVMINTAKEEENEVHACDFRPDGLMFATVGRDAAVRVYDETTNKVTNKWAGPGCHSDQLFAARWSRESKNVVMTAGWDDRVKIWDTRAEECVRTINGVHVCGQSVDSNTERQILVGSWRPDNMLQMYDMGTGRLMNNISWSGKGGDPSGSFVYAAEFSADASLIAAGGCNRHQGKLFDARTLQPTGLVPFGEGVFCVNFAPDTKRLALGGSNKYVKVLSLA